jgi:hypothetical protein
MALDRVRFKSSCLKIDRAEEHLETLKSEIGEWLDGKPYGVIKKFEPDSGRHSLVLEVRRAANFERFALIAGDCAQNLRCALDHLVYALALESPNGMLAKPRILQFPLCDTSEDFNSQRRRIAALTQEAQKFIESKQPYNRGHAELPPIMALLNAFNNIDKHRLVQVTYNCNSAGQISFTRAISQIVSRTVWANKSFDNGDEIAYFFSESKSEVPYNFAVSFTIGVSHIPGPGLRTTSPLEGVLVGMLAEVKRIVSEADGIGHSH